MRVQTIFVLLFAVNLILLWAVLTLKKAERYRFAGYQLLLWLPLLTVFFGQPRFELDYFWWRIAGAVAIALGLALRVWAKMEMRKNEVKPHDPLPSTLVTSGPFQYVRHPLYLSLVFILVGWWWVWAAIYSFYFGMFILALIWIQAYLEERFILLGKFGDKYLTYRQQVGMFWVK